MIGIVSDMISGLQWGRNFFVTEIEGRAQLRNGPAASMGP